MHGGRRRADAGHFSEGLLQSGPVRRAEQFLDVALPHRLQHGRVARAAHASDALRHRRTAASTNGGIDERRLAALPDSEADRLEEWAEKQERLDALNRAVERLDPEERALVTLFYYEDRSVGECAAITELSEGNVKVRLHRIRKKLYVLVNDEMNGTE